MQINNVMGSDKLNTSNRQHFGDDLSTNIVVEASQELAINCS